MSRQSNTLQRRAQIAQGLLHVMARRGYDGASVAEIAKAADLTPGLVHYHFANKQQILLAALDTLVAQHRTRLDLHLAKASPGPPQQVVAFISLHLGRGATADPDALACWVLMAGQALMHTEVQVPYAEALSGLARALEGIIEDGINRGVFGCANAAAAAAALVATIQGYFVVAAVARSLIPRGSAVTSVLAMAQGLLASLEPLEESTERPTPDGSG